MVSPCCRAMSVKRPRRLDVGPRIALHRVGECAEPERFIARTSHSSIRWVVRWGPPFSRVGMRIGRVTVHAGPGSQLQHGWAHNLLPERDALEMRKTGSLDDGR